LCKEGLELEKVSATRLKCECGWQYREKPVPWSVQMDQIELQGLITTGSMRHVKLVIGPKNAQRVETEDGARDINRICCCPSVQWNF